LVLNAAWSLLFFGLHNPGAALIEIVVLWALLAWLFVRFRRIDPVAGWLWLPYLLWVSFATMLNATIWYLN
jgi:tryptophan-rich sensory protein